MTQGSASFVPSIPQISLSSLTTPMEDAINHRPAGAAQPSRRRVNVNNSDRVPVCMSAEGTSAIDFDTNTNSTNLNIDANFDEQAEPTEGKRTDPYELLYEEARRDIAESRRVPRVVILVGLQGSGKSTFARRLLDACDGGTSDKSDANNNNSRWHRISQDELGTRRRCESACVSRLLASDNVLIDRCNFDSAQRAHWVQFARARGAHVGAVVFAVPLEECISRVQLRPQHETLEPGDPGVPGIVRRTAQLFRPPAEKEGLAWCRFVRNEHDTQRVLDEILRVQPEET